MKMSFQHEPISSMKPIALFLVAAKSSLTMAPDAGSMILPDLPFRGMTCQVQIWKSSRGAPN